MSPYLFAVAVGDFEYLEGKLKEARLISTKYYMAIHFPKMDMINT
jgi:aminopeptidase N